MGQTRGPHDRERWHGSRAYSASNCTSYQNMSPVLMLASILLYVAFFALGMGPGPWLIISEIFPTKVRGRAASIATSTLWSGTLVVTFTFLSLVKVLNLSGTFAIYGALSFACLAFADPGQFCCARRFSPGTYSNAIWTRDSRSRTARQHLQERTTSRQIELCIHGIAYRRQNFFAANDPRSL